METPIAKIKIEFMSNVSIEECAQELQRLANMWDVHVEASRDVGGRSIRCRARPLGEPRKMVDSMREIERNPPEVLPDVET